MKADATSMYEPEPTREAWHLLRKVFLLLLVATATALGLVLLARLRSNVPLVLFNILADTSLGLLAGFTTRFALQGRHGLIQGLASAAASLVGLGVLGYFTGWRSGIGPFQAAMVSVRWLDAAHIPLSLPLGFVRSPMNVIDLMNAIVAIDTSWLALRVWKQGPRVGGTPSLPAQRMRRPARTVEPPEEHPEQIIVTPIAAPAPVPARKRPAVSSGAGSSASRARVRRRNTERAVIARPASAVHPVRSRTRHNTSRRARVAVHLAVHEEHKCPYCFQPVSRKDPRGVVECPICHTLHHKDCWDITGNCQVPHLTTL